MKTIVSIFNDVIGPVMRGPSSSHCAASLRIGRIARDLTGGDFNPVLVEFDRKGSLPTTHETQGSDMGLFGGLMGWDAADERLPFSRQALMDAGVRISIRTVDADDPHPNTYRLTLGNSRKKHSLIAISTGGGMMEIINIDGFKVSIAGDCFETLLEVESGGRKLAGRLARLIKAHEIIVHKSENRQMIEVKADKFVDDDVIEKLRKETDIKKVSKLSPVLPVLSRKGMDVPFTTCSEMLKKNAGKKTPLWKLAVQYEMARGGLTEEQVISRMVDIVRILRRSIKQGIAGTRYSDRLLGPQSGRFKKQMKAGRLVGDGLLNRVTLYVSAMMEVKSSMGVIVAAPTAGACAALPGSVIAVAEELGANEEEIARAMLAAGLIGVFILTQWTFAAEVGGCQAECGAGGCMAAAALVSLAGGTTAQAVAAASMALQNTLGLVCDPVANRVEVPCLGRNAMAAANALSCASMALGGYDPVVPLDEVIESARRIAAQMPRELRCTALGGLSTTKTSKELEKKLSHRQRRQTK